MLRFLSQVLTEIVLILFYPVFSIFVRFIPKWELKGHRNGATIVIVERWLSINIRHVYWKYYLERKGFNVYLANFPLRQGSFQSSAQDLEYYIEKNKLEDIVLVGISSGAITALVYLQEHDGWNRVSRFIAVGAPFKGTPMAAFLSYSYSGRELLPQSIFIKKVSKYRILNSEKIVCIRARVDEMVPSGSVLPHTRGVVMNVVGHNNLHIQVRATYRKIMELAKD
jgi:pimeloyl-ACP methyl ester carboxylesterase